MLSVPEGAQNTTEEVLLKTLALCSRRYKLHQNRSRATFSLLGFYTLSSIRRHFRQGLSWNLRLEECESMSNLTSIHNQQLLLCVIMTTNINLLITIINNKVDFITYLFCYSEFSIQFCIVSLFRLPYCLSYHPLSSPSFSNSFWRVKFN